VIAIHHPSISSAVKEIMTKPASFICRYSISRLTTLFGTAMLLLVLSVAANAQYGNTATDGFTPEGLKAGAPAGSYQLSGFDNINYFNGNLNFNLPLLQVGGRGGVGFTIPLKIERKWLVIKTPSPPLVNTPEPNPWRRDDPGYGPGVLIGRRTGPVSQSCNIIDTSETETLTRLTFTAGNGTEYELRDTALNGAPGLTIYSYCSVGLTPNRGRVFVSTDGTGVTFISDTDILDSEGLMLSQFDPSGHLLMPDGSRYRIDDGRVMWIRDRNGNKISFQYGWGGVSKITDSLNREVNIAYGIDPATPYNDHDEITWKGAGGAVRTIKVWRAQMSLVMGIDRSVNPPVPYTIKTYAQLFPEMNGSNSTTFDQQQIVSAVELPDGRTYQFRYNSYGELARVELPTGGAIEYDYAAGVVDGPVSGSYGGGGPYIDKQIYRRVIERRVYSDKNSSVFEYKTVVSRPDSIAATLGFVDVENYGYSGALLGKERHYYYGTARVSKFMEPNDYSDWGTGKEWKTEIFAGDGSTVLRRVENTWQQPINGSSWPLTQPETNGIVRSNNPKITQTLSSLVDANLVSKQTFAYDAYFNQTDVYEHDYGPGAPGSLIRRTHTDYVTSNNGLDYAGDNNIHIRSLPLRQQVFDAGNIKRAETFYEYDNHNSDGLLHAPLSDCPNIIGHDSAFWTGYIIRGNVTKTARALLDNTGAATGWINSYAQYDIAGNVVKVIDGRTPAGITTFEFLDRFGPPGNDAQSNSSPSELAGVASYAFPTKVTNALLHTAYTKYDYYLGKPVATEDVNGVVSSVEYNDALDRPTQSIQATYVVGQGVPPVKRQTNITYDDANREITTRSDRDNYEDNLLKGQVVYDGLGRTIESRQYESASSYISVDTAYDALGRVSTVSNPYRQGEPVLLTTTTYDALGRVTRVTTPDNAHVDTDYIGNQVTVTDQAGKKRRSETDALGRLVNVTEDPGGTLNYDTTYLYDALGNLRKVTQGSQIRWFAYDSLSRLIRVRNPEQDCNPNLPPHTDPLTGGSCWAMAYSYDENGNLVSKTDANNITTTYAYDALNRNTLVDYSITAVNPDITRVYDNPNPVTNGKGRFWHDYAGGNFSTGQEVEHTAIDSYDALGRPLTKRQRFKKNGVWSENYSVSRTYDLAGNVKSVTYPSGRIVNYSHDQAGRLSSFSGNLGVGGAPSPYADTFSYNAAGQMIKERFGTNTSLYHNQHYNNRLQLVDIRLGDSPNDEWNYSRGAFSFLYGTTAVTNVDGFASDTDNNGNLRRQITWVQPPGGGYVLPQQHDYYYDSLNRIAVFREQQRNAYGQWSDSVSQAFSYDRWGNRTLDLSGGVGAENVAWVDDALPAGAVVDSYGGDNWTWVAGPEPAPYSGTVSHQSAVAAGIHQHFFIGATQTLQVGVGDRLYAYVYLDPANMPSEVMLQWYSSEGGWEHRAYWGADNIIDWGTNGTASRRFMGPLPPAGQWVRLEVDASAVGLEGKTLNGMAFTLFGGRANWDRAGKVGPLYGVTPLNTKVYTVDPATNRLATLNGFTVLYDAAGNQTNDGSGQRTYDAENRMVEAKNGADLVVGKYVYDADGRRVKRISNGSETRYIYGFGGELLAEYAPVAAVTAPQKEYGYRGGQLLVVWDGSEIGDRQLQWLVQDHLGSTRMVVDRSGSLAGITRRDYAPFGEELYAGFRLNGSGQGQYGYEPPQSNVSQKFGSKERDIETGLDFFEARYLASMQGRFTSPDPFNPVVDIDDEDEDEFDEYLSQPQNWNRYVYVWNNPLRYVDPDGERVYVVAYTTGNSEGDDEFRRAAETRANEIRKSKGYDPKKDTVLVKGVKTKQDFKDLIKTANGLEKTFGKVEQISLYSHSGVGQGPVFHDGGGSPTQFTNSELNALKVNWAGSGTASRVPL
jgi:RHS repeat-associated protein